MIEWRLRKLVMMMMMNVISKLFKVEIKEQGNVYVCSVTLTLYTGLLCWSFFIHSHFRADNECGAVAARLYR